MMITRQRNMLKNKSNKMMMDGQLMKHIGANFSTLYPSNSQNPKRLDKDRQQM
jgi:hypothetical protein